MKKKRKCTCGARTTGRTRECVKCATYVCRGCKRRVPWCFGAADDMPDHCDDCWAKAHRRAA